MKSLSFLIADSNLQERGKALRLAIEEKEVRRYRCVPCMACGDPVGLLTLGEGLMNP